MKKFGNKLDEILEDKQAEVEKLLPLQDKLQFSAQAREDFRSFSTALGGAVRHLEDDEGYGKNELSVIAEIKKGSPSAGTIVNDFNPVTIAKDYAEAGANALSVLTDEKYFQGHLSYLDQIREAVDLPLLRKDFIIHEVQIYESIIAGADAILLIVGALEQEELIHLHDIATNYQLDVLVEVHNLEEMERALETDAQIIGINNRNLKTFEVDLHATEMLSEEVGPYHILVSESGIYTGEDTQRIQSWGADAILVGEALMRSEDKFSKMAELKGFDPRST
ncbi:indole-3-glycerol phosphate synthase TrpC [Verrucomicrobiales bacterium]|jgi:indole-3-glycerol phosphate synthase|nr:indole-3-glycerol phosphate synthase TrpC [Verrucomicrobiales bacterium]|tara:strand:+ start:1071 stop:1907 length:837 start_codon:yes stop_codon:yes gene_type:complete